MGAYDFAVGSRFTPNAGMEANSFWQCTGEQASIWYSTSYYFLGARSLAFSVTSGFEMSSYHLAGTSGTSWDSYHQRWVSGAWGATEAGSEAPLGRIASSAIYQEINFGFKFPVNIPAATVVSQAYISIKCSSGYNPICYYPRISTLHGDTAYGYGSAYLASGWYEQTTTHQSSFVGGSRYYGKGQDYEYDLSPALQAMINSRGGIGSNQWINITFLAGSDSTVGAGAAIFFQAKYNPSSDTAVLDVEFTTDLPAGIGSNYVLHLSPVASLEVGSSYSLEGYAYIENGAAAYSARMMSSTGSEITNCPINVMHNNWTQFSQVFSVAAQMTSSYLRIDFNGGNAARVYFDDVVVRHIKNLVSLGVVEIYPEWEMKRYRKQIASVHRMKLGGRYVYRWGSYERFEIPLRYVAAEKALTINSWWQTADLMILKIESGGVWETNSVACVNKQAPLQRFEKGQNKYMYGTLELETF